MEGTSLYDIITVVILGAAVLYYFIVPAADAAVEIKQKTKKKQTEKDSEGPE